MVGIKQAIEEWTDARIRLRKSIMKMSYRVNKLDEKRMGELPFRYFHQKKIVFKELRSMDKILRKILKRLR